MELTSALLTVHSLIKQTPLPPFGKASGAVGACGEGLTVAVTILYHSKRSLGHYHLFPLSPRQCRGPLLRMYMDVHLSGPKLHLN